MLGFLRGHPYIFALALALLTATLTWAYARTLTTDAEEADVVLNTGPNALDDKVADYEALMQTAIRRKLPMICANPDIEVVMDGRLTVCAGGLARRYAELGGDIHYHGKPHKEIYERCFELLPGVDLSRVAMLGDEIGRAHV